MPSFAIRALCAAVLATAGLSGLSASAQESAAPDITPSPAFTAKQLTALPRENWITNGGNIYNQRYSPLDQINRSNVGRLKALWKTHMGSGGAPNNDGQAQILAYDGILYVVNGVNDVFAMDIETGKILWKHEGNPVPEAGVGKSSRGVGMGGGMIFVGQTDAKLVALDQKTGKVVWSIQAEDWKDGFSITSAPLYYDGMVITGFSGGELGIRGRVKAYNAKTGKLIWTFYTVPGPGQKGHDTWPADSDAWKSGGAPVWQTPAIDPELGMIYFSTGNPAPDLYGFKRPGDNLYTDSIVALDVHTGEYKWHFQEVHHDLWDYDAPNPIILYNAKYKGKMRKALVEVGKTGFAYILDRVTGEPLLGIKEKPVMQEPRQNTSKTQPYPVNEPLIPQYIDITPEGARLTPGGTTVINNGKIFTPFWDKPVATIPGPMGGANWPPSSFDPTSNTMYVCMTDRIGTYRISDEDLPEHKPGNMYMGGMFGQVNAEDRGLFAAYDVVKGKLVWRQQWRDICYSGSIVTAGGLVFVGRNDGRITALNSSNGQGLWSFLTDAGVNTTVTTVMHKGKQYVVMHAGGATFANSKKGDTIWLFSLDGKIDPVKPQVPAGRQGLRLRGGPPRGGGGDQSSAPEAAPPLPPLASLTPDLDKGKKLFKDSCEQCHGDRAQSGHGGGPTLVEDTTLETMMLVTQTGRNNMPSFQGIYTRQELYDISQYILQVLKKKT